MNYKKFTFKKIITLFLCAFLLCGCFGFFSFNNKVVSADSLENIGYFECSKQTNTFTVASPISGTLTSAEIEETSTVIPSANISFSDKKITIQSNGALSNHVLGALCTLKIKTSAGEYRYGVTFVTKAIRTASDCKVFDIATTSTIVDGYYVLLNDIDLGDSVFNRHVGIFETPNAGFVSSNGFAGTFNGLGHNITFVANNNGFFGRLIRNAKVINTGFTDVKFQYDTSYDRGGAPGNTCPILTRFVNIGSQYRGVVKDCYFHTDEDVQSGAISYHGYTTENLETKNILIDYGNLNSFMDITAYGKGVFIGNHTYCWSSPSREGVIDNVYVVSGYPLGVYAGTDKVSDETRQLITDKLNAGQTVNNYIRTYASNWGAQEDIYGGTRVFKKIKQYIDYVSMGKDANNFSSFNSEYWTANNGVLSWKNLEAVKGLTFSTKGSSSKDNVNLDASTLGVSEQKNFVTFYLAENYAKVDGAVITATMLDSYGSYTYMTDNVIISGNGTNQIVATADKDGVGRIKVTCSYQGKDYEYIIKLTVRNVGVDNVGGGTGGSGEGSGSGIGGGAPSNGGSASGTSSCSTSASSGDNFLFCLSLAFMGVIMITLRKTFTNRR